MSPLYTSAVSIHAPTGGATYLPKNQSGRPGFNSRAHGGRDLPAGDGDLCGCSFNSRAHGGRDSGRARPRSPRAHFNSRAHGGRDFHVAFFRPVLAVSIHAPTGGATGGFAAAAKNIKFQFTRPRGARPDLGALFDANNRFNSRAHGGRDRHGDIVVCDADAVSIHAPTGGATKGIVDLCTWFKFQFTRPRGARLALYLSPDQMSGVSIHAPTGGATGASGQPSRRASSFNSRAHGGRDSDALLSKRALGVSIHAPTGGATFRAGRGNRRDKVSIHAPTGGATRGAQAS